MFSFLFTVCLFNKGYRFSSLSVDITSHSGVRSLILGCMLHAHVQPFLQSLASFDVCLLDLLVYDLPKSMFKFINAKMTPKKRERRERATFLKSKLISAYDISL